MFKSPGFLSGFPSAKKKQGKEGQGMKKVTREATKVSESNKKVAVDRTPFADLLLRQLEVAIFKFQTKKSSSLRRAILSREKLKGNN